jgi:hypothetical protein
VEKFHQVDVVLLLSEVLLEEVVDSGFEHERVVDSDVTDAFLLPEVNQLPVTKLRTESNGED